MQEFLATIQSVISTQITLFFYRKSQGVIQQMADASYALYVKSVENVDSKLTIVLSNGMQGEGKSEMSVVIPLYAVFIKQSQTEWQIEYPLLDKTQVIKVLLPKKIEAVASQISIGKPSIKEFRNNNGKLARIYIESPEEGANIFYLEKIRNVLNQLLSNWVNITIQGGNTIDFLGESVSYKSIELIMIPGNTFFELHVETTKGERSIELATTLNIDLEKFLITFTLDDETFEISKTQ